MPYTGSRRTAHAPTYRSTRGPVGQLGSDRGAVCEAKGRGWGGVRARTRKAEDSVFTFFTVPAAPPRALFDCFEISPREFSIVPRYPSGVTSGVLPSRRLEGW